ncbi:MAG: hypothetical protein H6739_28205 [Alphaproteobacteria bacterium]|nr:hypothetical protein [Alphaproteobacteria bacterium]
MTPGLLMSCALVAAAIGLLAAAGRSERAPLAAEGLTGRSIASVERRMWETATTAPRRVERRRDCTEGAPTDHLDRVDLARRMLALNDVNGATRVLSGVLSGAPDHAQARLARGVAFYFGGRYDAALRDLVLAETLGAPVPERFVTACRQRMQLG